MKIRQKPYYLLLITIIFLLITPLLFFKDENAIDFHLHDTYFVVAHTHIFWLIAFILLIIWVLYLLTNKILYSIKLTWLHITITILSALAFGIFFYFTNYVSREIPIKHYDMSNFESMEYFSSSPKLIAICVFIFLAAQIIFLLNIILGILKPQKINVYDGERHT